MIPFLTERLPQPPSMLERFDSKFDNATSYYPFSTSSAGYSTRRHSVAKQVTKRRKVNDASHHSSASEADSDDDVHDANTFRLKHSNRIRIKHAQSVDRAARIKQLRKEYHGPDYSDSDESASDTDDEEYGEWADDFLLEVDALRREVYASGLCATGVDEDAEKHVIRTLYNQNHPNSPIMSRVNSIGTTDCETIPETVERETQLRGLRKDFYGPDYSDGDESAEDTDDEDYAEWVDDLLLEVDALRQEVFSSGHCALGDEKSEMRAIRSLYNLNHPASPVMSRAASMDSD